MQRELWGEQNDICWKPQNLLGEKDGWRLLLASFCSESPNSDQGGLSEYRYKSHHSVGFTASSVQKTARPFGLKEGSEHFTWVFLFH